MGRPRKKLIFKNSLRTFSKFFGDKENIWILGSVKIKKSVFNNDFSIQIRHGFWRYYHKNGQVAHSGKYNNGRFVDRWKEYDEQGKKIKEKIYII